uniref:Tr-type G domain-containing protein n=1 Tax=Opuntia streptacantha TaxID=393608 RepID=A0A7C9CYX7_OPUST
MSRKATYGYDYDDVYDDYEDYEDDECYDDGYEGNGEAAPVNENTTKVKPGVWRCSICTYDNDETMSYCDICGVLRYPPSNTGINYEQKTGAPPGFAEKNAATTMQSTARQTNSSFAFKGKNIPLEEHNNSSEEREKYFNDTSTVVRNSDAVAGTSHSKRTDNTPTRNQKSKHDDVAESSSLAKGAKPASLSSSSDSLSLNRKSGSPKPILPRRNLAQYKPEKWMLPDKEGNVTTQLNLAIVGHVDSGKSTLSGRLLHLLGQISQKQMHKYEKESKQQGKGSFAYAWALDESAEERERGITMTVAVAYFDTKKYHVVVLDSPGHKDFVPNMISGATQADAAILVIDASVGAYETGMDVIGGQSREHAQLIRSFGVDQVIVAINKMDAVGYSKERFELIKRQVGSFLRQCGFKESFISWVPLSAMENQNLVTAASDDRLKSWYKGPHLLDAIDLLHPPRRDYEKPLIMPICDVIKTQSMGQVSASGKLEAGALRSGCKVLVMPLGEVATVRSIECNSQPCSVARAGDNVSVVLQGIDVGHVIAGGVLCHPDFPVKVASRLEIKILVLEAVKTPILIGSQLEFHIHHTKEAARVVKIVSLLDPKTGKETKKAPRCLLSKQSAIIEVALQAAVCVEEASTCKALGRVFLRSSGRTVAVGVVTRVIEDKA